MPRLLVRQRMHDTVADFDEGIRGDRMQIAHLDAGGQRFAATRQLQFNFAIDSIIEHRSQRLELRDQLAIDPYQDVARLQHVVALRAGLHLGNDQHARIARELAAHQGFGSAVEAETPQLVIRGIGEYGLQRAASHRLTLLDQGQRAFHARQWQVEARCGTTGAAGIQRNGTAFDVDHR